MKTNGKIINPITMAKILKKAEEYNFFDFWSDVSWLVHNCHVRYPTDDTIIDASNDFKKFVDEEISSSKECTECFEIIFRNSNGFSIPCKNKHELVWAKSPKFCYFPAKLMRRFDDESISVRYFGDQCSDRIEAGNFRAYSEICPDAGTSTDLYNFAIKVCSMFTYLRLLLFI